MPEIVSMLLKDFSANVNAENLKKATPLHRASAGGCSLCVEYLLNRGADVEFCDSTGRKPIDVGGNDAVRELIRVRCYPLSVMIIYSFILMIPHIKFNDLIGEDTCRKGDGTAIPYLIRKS